MAKARATDRRLYLLLEIAARRIQREADARLRAQADVSAAQAAVLFLLLRRGARRMGAIGEVLALNPPAVTGLVARMEAADLVKKVPDREDRRGTLVALTELGRARAEAADQVLREINADLDARLGKRQAEALHKALTALAAGP